MSNYRKPIHFNKSAEDESRINAGSDFDLDEGKVETVNHPAHYKHGDIECIDAMESAFGRTAVEDFCIINAFKYLWRSRDKGGLEDIDKAVWYLNKYKELMSKTID